MLLKEKTCESCGISFITESTAKRHCTYKCCRDKHSRKRKKIYKPTNCASCYNLMIPKHPNHKYCTRTCADAFEAFKRTQAKEQRIQNYMKQPRTCTWCQISKIPINANYTLTKYCTLKCKKQAERYRAKQRKRNQQHNTPIKEETEETPFTQASRIW